MREIDEKYKMNPTFKKILDYCDDIFHKLEEQAKQQPDLLEELQSNKDYIYNLLIEKYFKALGIPKINRLTFKDAEKALISSDKDSLQIVDYMKPIEAIVILLSKEFKEFANNPKKLSEELNKLLISFNIPVEHNPTLVSDITRVVKRKLAEFANQSKSENNANSVNLLHEELYKRIERTIALILASYTIADSVDIPFTPDKEKIKKFGKETGCLTNKKIIEETSLSPVDVNNILDMDELFEAFENGTISVRYKKFILPHNFAKKFIEYSQDENNKEKADKYLKEITIKSLIQSFEIGFIDFKEFITIVKNPNFYKNKRSRIKEEIRKLFVKKASDKNDVQENIPKRQFTHKELLELAKIHLVSDIDIMRIYLTQEEIKEKFPSVTLFEDEGLFISEEEMKDFFDADRLLKNYFKPNNDEFYMVISFYKEYILPHSAEDQEKGNDFSEQLKNDPRVTANDLVKLFSDGLITLKKMKEFSCNDEEVKKKYYAFLKESPIDTVFTIVNNGGLNEDDLIEIYDDDYEKKLREAIRKGLLYSGHYSKFSYLENSSIIFEEYQNALNDLENNDEENSETVKRTNFYDVLAVYIYGDNLLNIEELARILQEHRDPIFKQEDFNLSSSIMKIMEAISKDLPDCNLLPKIKELFNKSYITLEDLEKLAEKGIITYEEAEQLNAESINSKLIDDISSSQLGNSSEKISPEMPSGRHQIKTPISHRESEYQPSKKEIAQAEAIIQYMESLGFSPKITTNVHGIDSMDTFSSGDFKNYRVFLPQQTECAKIGAVVLVHLKKVPNTNIYYHVGNNATYIMSISKFAQYLKTTGLVSSELLNFETTKADAMHDPNIRRANVGKTWTTTVPRKIGEIMNMLKRPKLQELKDSEFEIASLFPSALSQSDISERLEFIKACAEEFLKAKNMSDDE